MSCTLDGVTIGVYSMVVWLVLSLFLEFRGYLRGKCDANMQSQYIELGWLAGHIIGVKQRMLPFVLISLI